MIPAALVLFGKVPLPGRVKTRLAAAIGEQNAARLSEAFLGDFARILAGLAAKRGRLDLIVAGDPFPHAFWSARFPAPWRAEPQNEGDLGRRLGAAVRREFSRFERVAVLGADHPGLPHGDLERFLEAPNAIWPTRDGGYAALSLTRSPGALSVFDEIPWSTPAVFRRTLERARAAAISMEVFPETDDVDHPEDLERLAADLETRDRESPLFPRETWERLEAIRSESRAARL